MRTPVPRQVRDLQLFQPLANSPWKRHPTLYHPERSAWEVLSPIRANLFRFFVDTPTDSSS
jgi:hypothetical protein